MSNVDLIFLLLALTNMDIGLNNYSKNTGQQQEQENIKYIWIKYIPSF